MKVGNIGEDAEVRADFGHGWIRADEARVGGLADDWWLRKVKPLGPIKLSLEACVIAVVFERTWVQIVGMLTLIVAAEGLPLLSTIFFSSRGKRRSSSCPDFI
jgi:hypothetical protein